MEWLSQNWVWIVAGVRFIAIHWFGHGGHGGHRGHGQPPRREPGGGGDRERGERPRAGSGHAHCGGGAVMSMKLAWKGFAIGLAKSFLDGVIVGLVYVPIYNGLRSRFGA